MNLDFLRRFPVVGWILDHRFTKFGSVGASGTLVNLFVLYLGQEFLFAGIEDEQTRINLSLSLAIACSTTSNFLFNRIWTWRDRKEILDRHLLTQYGQYVVSASVAIALQFIFTKILANHMFYLFANVIAIGMGAVANYLLNDGWTFATRSETPAAVATPIRRRFYAIVLVVAIAAYFAGLDSLHIPKNGDEYPYAHITRLTAASGQLLPLQADLPGGMRNTKPPLLFWQGIASTGWGENWSLWNLRAPSVVYTLLTALMAGLLGWRCTRHVQTGFIAALAYLAFFSTYRYGRPFLTNPPEVFWVFLPFFLLLFWRSWAFASRIRVPLVIGLATGIALLYKSPVLVVPVGAAVAWWYLAERGYRLREFLRHDLYKPVLAGVLALGIFGLWFLLDPEPEAIWHEFIIGENLGKLDRVNYLGTALWGKSSIPALAGNYVLNAGLLLPLVLALAILTWLRRQELGHEERLLLIWIFVLFLFYAVPSQRSGRYLLPAMPAIAVLLALVWERIPKGAFRITTGLAGALLLLIGALSFRIAGYQSAESIYPLAHWLLIGASFVVVGVGLLGDASARFISLPAVFLAYLGISSLLSPFDKGFGRYDESVQTETAGLELWVPQNFGGKYERYYFLLPEANIRGYDAADPRSPAELLHDYPIVAIQSAPSRPPDWGSNHVLGTRWDLRTRQSSGEIRALLFDGDLDFLITREFLVKSQDR